LWSEVKSGSPVNDIDVDAGALVIPELVFEKTFGCHLRALTKYLAFNRCSRRRRSGPARVRIGTCGLPFLFLLEKEM